ncbi:hypothetical protein OBBRIDRAFT_839576 [Obba rivulosa]|uniref:Uncharacterized protein n=1 Tax=Obba rivulosa TaxID=1052685 RepID=A0A8E2ALT1_9APHY|nr:hypothetical protein OBBRIDRAFT_839576 [Obba rivulosa]
MSQFLKVLAHAHALEEVNIRINDHTLEVRPELPQTLESLNSLRALSMSFNDGFSDAMEMTLRVHPLTKLHLEHVLGQAICPTPDFLRGHSGSLTELTIHPVKLSALSSDHVQLPHLRRLDIRISYAEVDTALLVCLFPHIAHLNLAEDLCLEAVPMDEVRACNMLAQTKEGCSWPHLEVVSGNAWVIYAAALTCKVVRLKMDVYVDSAEDLDSLLSETRPCQVELRIHLLRFGPDILEQLLGQAPETVTDLVLNLTLYPGSDPAPERYLAASRVLLDNLKLSRVEIHLTVSDGPFSRSQLKSVRHIEQLLQEVDVRSFLVSVVERLPTLSDALVLVKNNSTWRYRRSAGGDVLLERMAWLDPARW